MVITLREEGRLGQAQRMQAATRSWKINSGACGRMLTGSLLASQAGKGIYHVKEAIASSTLQIAPSAYICTHIHTHTSVPAQGLAPSTWPLSVAERVYSLWQWHSVVLLEMELSPSNLRHCRELAHIKPRVLWPSCPTSRGEKLSAPGTTPSIQPHARWCFLYLLVLNELETILYSSVSQTVLLCRARLICFARSCLKMTDRVLIKPEQIQNLLVHPKMPRDCSSWMAFQRVPSFENTTQYFFNLIYHLLFIQTYTRHFYYRHAVYF